MKLYGHASIAYRKILPGPDWIHMCDIPWVFSGLVHRDYVSKERRSLVPTSQGRLLASFLQRFFSKWVDFQFTSGMEQHLDDISAGNADLHAFLSTFWHELEQSLQEVEAVTVQQVCSPVSHYPELHSKYWLEQH